jgi:hypothetical protein
MGRYRTFTVLVGFNLIARAGEFSNAATQVATDGARLHGCRSPAIEVVEGKRTEGAWAYAVTRQP